MELPDSDTFQNEELATLILKPRYISQFVNYFNKIRVKIQRRSRSAKLFQLFCRDPARGKARGPSDRNREAQGAKCQVTKFRRTTRG